VLGVDEDAAQTSAIIRAQRTAASLTGFALRVSASPFVVVTQCPTTARAGRGRHPRWSGLVSELGGASPPRPREASLDGDGPRDAAPAQRERRTVLLNGVALSYLEATSQDVAYASKLCGRVLVRDLEAGPKLVVYSWRSGPSHRAGLEGSIYDVEVTRRQLRERLAGQSPKSATPHSSG